MTVGLVIDDTLDRADGVQQAVLSIGAELTRRGHEVHYITSNTERADLANVHSMSKSLALRFNGNSVRTPLPASKDRITQLFKTVKFDVLHVQMPCSPLMAARVLRAAPEDVVRVGTFHILPYTKTVELSTKLLGFSLRKTLRALDSIFAVSEPARIFMQQSFRVDGDVLPNPVDYRFFNNFKRQKSNKLRLVYVGRFEERKGVKQLLEAFKEVVQFEERPLELIMCGTGPLYEWVKMRATELKLPISFPGFVSDDEKAQHLANADIAVFPSTSGESFGIVLAEAMAAGATVTLGGNNPGYASVLGAWSQTLFDPNNTAAFAKTLRKFLDDKDLRRSIGKKQHQAVKQYDVRNIVEVLEAAYKG